MQKTKKTDDGAVKGGFVTAKAAAKSRLLSACWFGEVSEIFAKASRTCRAPGAALAQEGEGRAVLLRARDLLVAVGSGYPQLQGAGCCARGVWPWGVGGWTWVLITHLLFWSSVPKGTEQMLWALAEIQGKCMASGLSSATQERPGAAA